MRCLIVALCLAVALLATSRASAGPRTHVVAEGHNLGKIAKRYGVTVEALCKANGIERREPIHAGDRLVIPDKDDKDGARAHSERERGEGRKAKEDARREAARSVGGDGMKVVDLRGAGALYYYEPEGPGRLTMRPIMLYMHGRGANPQADCRRWAPVARRLGWLACPTGPIAHGAGWRWGSWATALSAARATVQTLREKYGRRVQLYGNTIVGFSEGAFAAMNVGVREPRTFNRWLILAAKDSYWGGPGIEELASARDRVRRVYLITGELDGVIDGTRKVREMLRKAGIPTRITTPKDIGHELALERRRELYRMALVWLEQGAAAAPTSRQSPVAQGDP
jgi:predicted esterase